MTLRFVNVLAGDYSMLMGGNVLQQSPIRTRKSIISTCLRVLRFTSLLAVVTVAGIVATVATAAQVPGRIGGTFSVSPMGAATYSIPILVAEGALGLRPDIELVYSSQGGDGLAGIGWTLSGFSKITRCALTIAVDNKMQGVQYSAQDRFCLDGIPLVYMGMAADGAKEYRTEVYRHQQIKAYGSLGTGPAVFTVQQPNGTVHFYGYTANSRIQAPGTGGEIRVWAVGKVSNSSGHQIEYKYVVDATNGEYYPDEVRWTYASDQSAADAKYALKFTVESRNDSRTGYVGGSPWQTSKRLTTIEYKFNSQLVHTYSLGYEYGTSGRSRLTSVSQAGPDDSLKPTQVLWADGVSGFGNEITLPYNNSGGPVLYGDFNGDGDADIYRMEVATQPNLSWRLMLSQGDGTFASLVDTGLNAIGNGQVLLDYNGDGRQDVLYNADLGPNDAPQLALSTGDESGSGSYFTTPASVPGLSVVWQTYVPVDLNGDGLDDLARQGSPSIISQLNNGTGFASQVITTLPGSSAVTLYYPGPLQSADFDGDGRDDLLVARGTGSRTWEAYLSNGNGFTTPGVSMGVTTSTTADVMVLDINGDGLSDVLLRNTSGIWTTRLSTGKAGAAFVAPTCTTPVNFSLSKTTVVDYDGDGRMDVLRPDGATGWRVQRSDGRCYLTANYTNLVGGTSPSSTFRTRGVDVTGDGSLDIVIEPSTVSALGKVRVHNAPAEGPVPDVVRRITDGLDNYHAPKYQVLSNWSGYHVSGSDDLPNGIRLIRGGPWGVVSEYVETTGVGSGTYTVSNEYWSARSNFHGRGFLGFEAVKSVDDRNNIATDTRYKQLFPYTGQVDLAITCTGATGEEARCADSGANKITRYAPVWNESAGSGGSGETAGYHFPYVSSEVRDRYEVNSGAYLGAIVTSTSRALSNWDFSHGIAKTEVTTTTSPQGGGTWTATKALILNDTLKNDMWCLRLPSKIDTTKSGPGGVDPVRTIQIQYHDNCAPYVERVGPELDQTKQLKTVYGLDYYGRLQTITQSRGDGNASVPSRQTIIDYDPVGYRPESESFVIAGESNHVVGHVWDNALGFETSRTSVQGQTTSWESDDFGRMVTETRPSGSSEFVYTTCGTCFPSGAKYTIQENRSDDFSQTISYDSMARMVGRAQTLITGESREEFGYNDVGFLTSQTVPYLVGDTSYSISRTFDLTGRPTSESRQTSEADSTDTTTTWDYSRLTTSVTKSFADTDTYTVNYTSDPEGRLSAVDVPLTGVLNGDAAYGYTAWGELETIQDAGGAVTTMYYDDRGFRYQVDDANSGTRVWEFNVFGEVEKVRDALTVSPGWTSETTYDQLGRPTQRTESEGTTAWTYYKTVGSSKGLLERVVSPTPGSGVGFDESYLYTSLAQLKTLTTKINGTSYITDYTYNTEGQLDVMTYPAGVGGVRGAYKHTWANGYLDTIAQDPSGVAIYDVVSMDALGRETHSRLGNNVVDSQHVYDRASTRINEIKAGPSMGASHQWYTYAWDKAGNLRQRVNKNNATPIAETFSYDKLNRLTNILREGVETQSYSYNANGTIDTRIDQAVSYQYYYSDSSHPHAVTSTETVVGCSNVAQSYGYNPNGSMTNRHDGIISYTSFDLPKEINTAGTGCLDNCSTFAYGSDRQLIQQVDKKAGATRTITYVAPHFEIETAVEAGGNVTKYRSNVLANNAVVYSLLDSTGAGGLQAYWPLRDHLGSVDTLRRESGGGPDGYRFSFDAFGKRRNADDWTPDSSDALQVAWDWNHRGFTDHEHLDTVKLVHMKGRVYDPKLGRMLSVDPVLGDLTLPQTLNAYSYVANNPLAYTDPDGLFLKQIFETVFGDFGKQALGNVLGFAFGGAVCDSGSTGCAVAANFAGQTVASADGDGIQVNLGASFGGARSGQLFDGISKDYVLNIYDPFPSEQTLLLMGQEGRDSYYDQTFENAKWDIAGLAGGYMVGKAIQAWRLFRTVAPAANATLGVAADTGATAAGAPFSKILSFTPRNLQKGFTKHGADFGLTGNWNPSRAAEFSAAINKHINAPGVRSITGSYRGQTGFVHHLDPQSGLNVVTDLSGNYVTGFRLGGNQLGDLLSTGGFW
jgi:RHS repeat-associated protein